MSSETSDLSLPCCNFSLCLTCPSKTDRDRSDVHTPGGTVERGVVVVVVVKGGGLLRTKRKKSVT